MGQRGPKPLPGNVHRMRGNASRKALADLDDGVWATVEIPSCPKHLLPEARKEWKRIGPELLELGLVAKMDRAALALYCQAWARWVWCEQQLQRSMAAAEQLRDQFERERQAVVDRGETWTRGEWAGGDGFMIPTPNGAFTYSPHWVGANKAADQVDKFLQSFGMSPSSRSRVKPSDVYPYLPGLEPVKEGEAKPGAEIKTLADFARKS